jgi:hypothetical protein
MLISKEIQETRNKILDFEKRIEEMHLEFQKYCQGLDPRMPDYEHLERELLFFSRRKIFDLELSKQLDRVLYKFQNRKRIWVRWAEEFQQGVREKTQDTKSPQG